jgi:glycosyltransferase involved in cell wall biosynthesis
MRSARAVGPGSSAALGERVRHLAYFCEHAALAAALRAVPRARRPRPDIGDRPLRVALLSAYPRSHYGTVARFTRWVPHLEQAGCEVELLTPSTDAEYAAFERGDPAAVGRYYRACVTNQWRNVRRAADADVAVLHRGLFPFSPWQRATFEQRLARLDARIVYDFYDAIWLQRQVASDQPASRLGQWLHPPDKVEQIIRLARVVTVSNESLAEFARQHHPDVRILPMLLEPAEYQPREHHARSPVVLGWMGNRHQIPRLLSLGPALRRLAETRDIVLRVVAPEPVDIPGVQVESSTHPWSPQSERQDLAALDVGLLPLEDSAHDRGKSPLKLLQYALAGLPVVATPVAIDERVLPAGECFLAANNEREWLESLTALVDDPALRARLGNSARAAVVANYSFESYTQQFMDALLTAAGSAADTRARVHA